MTHQILSHLTWCCVPRPLNPCRDWWDASTTGPDTLFRRWSLFFSYASSRTYVCKSCWNEIAFKAARAELPLVLSDVCPRSYPAVSSDLARVESNCALLSLDAFILLILSVSNQGQLSGWCSGSLYQPPPMSRNTDPKVWYCSSWGQVCPTLHGRWVFAYVKAYMRHSFYLWWGWGGLCQPSQGVKTQAGAGRTGNPMDKLFILLWRSRRRWTATSSWPADFSLHSYGQMLSYQHCCHLNYFLVSFQFDY